MSRNLPLINLIAHLVQARRTCRLHSDVWEERHTERLRQCEELLPSGSGIDNGTTIDLERSTADRIILHTSYHHMDESGMYDGWTDHTVTVRPSFIGSMDITVSGRDRNMIKEYLQDTFHATLAEIVTETAEGVTLTAYAQPTV